LFFLRSLKSQIGRLKERLEKVPAPPIDGDLPGDLSPLAGRLLSLLEERKALSVGDAAEALGVNRNTLKGKFAELTDKGYAELHGKGRGAHYRRKNRKTNDP
jgi:DNA-binding transcriptional ArsR family regulator